jgi:hypothetical protein
VRVDKLLHKSKAVGKKKKFREYFGRTSFSVPAALAAAMAKFGSAGRGAWNLPRRKEQRYFRVIK